jgi:putrescine transport system substrate-binding protein
VAQARRQANESRSDIKIDWVIPDEGSLLWIDELAVPKDAPHVANAHLFINYLLNPRVIADISNSIGFANGNIAALPLLDPAIAKDPIIYPPPDQQRRLFLQLDDSAEQTRAITRLWQKFKTGQ